VLREYVDVGEFDAKELRPQLNELMAASRKRPNPVRLIVTPRTTEVLISRVTGQVKCLRPQLVNAMVGAYGS